MKKLRLLLAVILSSAFFYGCKKDKGDDATGKLETILTANAVVIEQAQQNDVLSTSENQIVLQAGSVTAGNAEVGSVLASGITANAPYGFLRKVVSKQTVGNTVVLSTEPAYFGSHSQYAPA